MDSVTQVTLGAAVGEAVAGREAGGKAPVWGGLLGLLPDLDVLANPFLTEAQSLTFHRSVTHSLVFAIVATACVAVGLRRLHSDTPVSLRRWAGLAAAALFTHIGLDCLTTYGTQIFWPFSQYPVILGTVFVIDPLYTVPLAAGLLASLRGTRSDRIFFGMPRRWLNYAGLGLSSAYLLVTLVNKWHVNRVFGGALARQVPSAERFLTTPTPFNNLLWRGVAEADDGYYIGFYSLLDDDRSIHFRYVPHRHDLLGDTRENTVPRRLRRFSRGYYIVRRAPGGDLRIHDLRFGRNDLGLTSEGQYLFTYHLQEGPGGRITGMRQEEPPIRLTRPLLRKFWARIRGQTAVVPPTLNAKPE
ncbi:MAG: metal-dependent hydrolase [Salinibacter sp.]|uniref:metal-dependent hydrolase n=1 Tax=Salinibacter sp. TaxID=2065818 RepID=UPI0035D429B6